MDLEKLTKFDQIGIVVRDIEKSLPYYEAFFKFKSDLNIVEQDTQVVYKGEPATFRLKKIMEHFGDKQFEIVEVVKSSGNHLYKTFLDEGKEGLHHIGIYIKNSQKYIEKYEKDFGIKVIQTGKVGKRVRFDYLDTYEKLGWYLELIGF
jgi:catechol 2,3-dioxygenase-like lactoylglutathione lyase family enzyme